MFGQLVEIGEFAKDSIDPGFQITTCGYLNYFAILVLLPATEIYLMKAKLLSSNEM